MYYFLDFVTPSEIKIYEQQQRVKINVNKELKVGNKQVEFMYHGLYRPT